MAGTSQHIHRMLNSKRKQSEEATSRDKTMSLGLTGNTKEKQERELEKNKMDQEEATLLGKQSNDS